MADSLRDLVVSLSLNTDNFTKNIAMVNRQIKEAESAFKLAGAGITNFGSTSAGAAAYVSSLQQRIGLQRNVVDQYGKALTQANQKLTDSYNRYTEYGNRLNEAKTKLQGLSDQVKVAAYTYETFKAHFGENDTLTQNAASNLRDLSLQYQQQKDEVEKLSGQYDALRKSMENAANTVSTTQTALNNATAKLKDMERELQTLTSGWTKVGNTLVNVGTKMQSVGKTMSSIGKSMTMFVTLPIAALGKNAVQASIDFESSFTSVRKTVDATEEEFARLADASKEMSTQIAASTTAINEVMATGGQLGVATENLEDFTRVMIDLGNSTEDLDAQNAATQLAKFANVMGTDQSKFENIGSTIVELGNNFATTEAPIAEMAQRLAGAGKQVGLTEAQVLGFATALSSVGIQAQMGGSAMSKALIKMELAAETGGEALDDFAMVSGMTASQFQEVWRSDPAAAFQAFINGLSKLDDEGASAIKTLNDIGISEIRLRDTLMRATNANELFARAQTMATNAWQKNTALATEANKRYATLESRLTNLKNKATLLGQTFGNDLRPTIEKLMAGADAFIEKLMGMDSGSRQLVITLAGIAAAAGPVLLIFGKMTEAVGSSLKAFGNFFKAVGSGASKFAGFVEEVGFAKVAMASFAIVAAHGVYRLIDWASGASAAREAQAQLNETVKQFGENVTTAYEKSAGLSLFGLAKEDFAVSKENDPSTWFEETIKTWTDGKKETDEIVSSTVGGFTDGTEQIRSKLKQLQTETGGSMIGDLDSDISQLDKIDAEVESILKKRQNGMLTDADKVRLQDLIDQREAIEIKYRLVSDTDDAFQKITDGVESAMSRNADGATTFVNAFSAATQGLGAFTDSLNAEYDARHAVISAMDEGAEKDEQFRQLSEWYNTQKTAAIEQYANTLQKISDETGAFSEGGEFEQTAQKLNEINTLMQQASGKDSTSSEMTKLRDALAGLDETDLVEAEAAVGAIESACADAGIAVPEDVQKVSAALEAVKAAALDTSNVFSEDVAASIQTMFAGLGEEAHEVFATLNCDGLSTAYDAWAAGGHADIIPTITTDPITTAVTASVNALTFDGLTGTISVVTGNGDSFTIQDITINPETGHIEAMTADGKTLSIDSLNLAPETGHIEAMTADGKRMSISALNLNPETGHVEAVTADGKHMTIMALSLDPLTGTVTAVSGEGKVFTISNFELEKLTGTIGSVVLDPNLVTPTVEVKATITEADFENGTFTGSGRPDLEYTAGTTGTSRDFFGFTDWSAAGTVEQLNQLATAVREYNAAVESGDQNTIDSWTQSVSYLGSSLGDELGYEGGKGFTALAQSISSGLQLMSEGKLSPEDVAQLSATITDLQTILSSQLGSDSAFSEFTGQTLQEGLASGLQTANWDVSADSVLTQIEAAFGAAQAQMNALGGDISAGIGEGEAGYDFSGDASSTIGNNEAALRSAAESNSPAQRFVPLGSDISAGIGEGMVAFSFAASASMAASNLQSAANGSFTTSLLQAAGLNAMTGLAAGIRSGTSYVTSAIRSAARAAVSAAKSELVIKSPSHVFRDEVGVMTMRGFGEGVLEEMDAQAKIIRNAARYLTSEARDGVTGIATTDNRRTTYNETSSVNLYVDSMSIRDRQDIESLASEIASLTKRRQVGRGMA